MKMDPDVLMYLILGGIILCFGVFGNGIVIFYFGFIRKCNNTNELLMFLLGITDFVASISNLMYDWSYKINPFGWKYDLFNCKYIQNFTFSFNKSSCYVLALMFYVRYRCVSDLLSSKRQITKKKIVVTWLVLLLISFAIRVPSMLGKKFNGVHCKTDYTVVFGNKSNYLIYRLVMYPIARLLLPLVCMVYCYCRTKRYLKLSGAALNNDSVNKRNKRILRTILFLAVLFVISVAPIEIYLFIIKLSELTHLNIELNPFISSFFSAFYYLNSSINVVIYAGLIGNFRRFCYKLICCCEKRLESITKVGSVRTTEVKYL